MFNKKKSSWNVHGQGTIQRGWTGKPSDEFLFEVTKEPSDHIAIEAGQVNDQQRLAQGKEDYFKIVMSEFHAVRLATAILQNCLQSAPIDANCLLKILAETHAKKLKSKK